ncbi:MAG: acetyl-CoA carboxylase biotin carboxyl carrier protein subunit [Muriicola sp.]|nr:acetyl-CoA carboxylase biotin carboxyl carrier protein subunit [Muriicola sp.]MBT8283643.1 acetyl-CoA carboxylase biotin carboxyl carrier protein subunit [Muriicola sp.]NNK12144.1 biotin/lipoyl-binding protein [Flavobacteriaceae bacterium]
MPHKFKVSVNETHEFTLTESDLEKIDILQTAPAKYHVLKDNQPFTTEVVGSDFRHKTYSVKLKNEVYEVVLADDLDQQITRMGFSLGSTKSITAISAPMPGLILEIRVKEGDAVNEDSPLLILEAMKMENVITSPREGIIKKISVKAGETVDKKQLLISYE